MENEVDPTAAFSPDQVRDFVIAAHGNLPRVREMLAEHPGLLNLKHQWAEGDSETAIQAAAQVGSASVVEYLLDRGAPLEICTAAMLGRRQVVERMLEENPGLIEARGAHGIPLMPHAALSNNLELAQMLFGRGATAGMSQALGNAVSHGEARMARWILETGQVDMHWKNYEGKSLMTIATETGTREMVQLLRKYGAT
jgi:ankyrin repeat protein